jgi:cation-transporting ATPase I
MSLPNPLAPIARTIDRIVRPGRWERRAWNGNGRAHVEVRGVHREGRHRLAEAVETELARLQGVNWAEVNAITGRVVVAFDGDAVDLDDLVEVVEAVEEAHDVHTERFPQDRPEHPADAEPLQRNLLALGADLVGLGVAAFGQILRATPFPGEIAGVVSLADSQPRVRSLLDRTFGHPTTEATLALASAMAQALSGGPLGLVVDAAHRANLVGEVQARRAVWARREPELSRRHADRLPALEPKERPGPLPAGPIESYSDRASLASLGAFGVALAATRDPRRAANALLAGIPKAARQGREAFASQLGRDLAARGVVAMDSAVLRRLDRVDTVVIDAAAVRAEHAASGSRLDPLAGALAERVRSAGLALVVAGGRSDVRATLGAERVVAGGARLATSIRALQADGHGVLLVSAHGHAALAAADCGVGILGADHPPAAADLLCGPGLEQACFIVEATAVAREVSRRAALLALAGSAVGGAWATVGTGRGATQRALIPVNVSALAAQAGGVWSAVALGRQPAAVSADIADWHAVQPAAVLAGLSSTAAGLSSSEAARRRGPKVAVSSGPVRLARAVTGELVNPLTPLLGLGAALSAAVGSAADAALVGGVVVANAAISGAQRVMTQRSLERLFSLSATTASARRDGTLVSLPATDLVVGDVVEVSAGDVVPADCRVLDTGGVEVDESALTGESVPVRKAAAPVEAEAVAERASMLYEGTTVVSGAAVAVVVATGTATEVGRSLAGAAEPPPSGVEARLARLTALTVPVTVAAGAAVAGMGLLQRRGARDAIGAGTSLMVAAVPEGLPLLSTVAQQAAARRLSAHGALVRNPRTIEALGRVDVLCFDKTGTLTQGRIGLARVSDGTSDESLESLGAPRRAVLAAALRASPAGRDESDLVHPTDRAVVDGARAAGVRATDGLGSWQPVTELAFESGRGFHAVLGRTPSGPRMAVKGAPEVVLARVGGWRSGEERRPLDRRTRHRLETEAERLAAEGLRVLAVAEGAVDLTDAEMGPGLGETHLEGLDVVGFVALADRVRPTAAAAVDRLRRAGVQISMVTGDHRVTAAAIASELGILDGGRVLTGPELDRLDDAALAAALADSTVFARITPTQKVRIVEAYQRAGRVVAMTGDGANDAAAIRLADAGVALGRRCTPSAREAADLVVTEDRIETIVAAIVEGRAMWTSVRDALAILVGGNLGEVGFTLVAAAATGASPLSARQLLLVNLFTDLVPAMAIAIRPPAHVDPEVLLHEGPDASLGGALARDIALRAVATAGGATGAWLVARGTGRARRARTVALVALVGTQLGQTAVVGGASPLALGATAASAAALVAVVQTPGLSQFFGCAPLDPVGWGIALGAAGAATGAAVAIPRIGSLFKRP